MSTLDAWLAPLGTTPLEVAGVLTGLANVWLTVQQRLLAWPIGIVNAALYLVIFARAGLYADTGLQLVYVGLSAYGWWHWARGGPADTRLEVTRLPQRDAVVVTVAMLGAWALLTTITRRLPGAAVPAIDAALVAGSLGAQWLMTRKRLECWLLWIVINVGYVALFVSRQLRPTAALYAVYGGLAVLGFRQWRSAWMHRTA